MRIAVIADIHAAEPVMGVAKLREIVQRTQSLEADLIVLAGDYVSNRALGMKPVPMPVIATELQALRAPSGVFAVLGNHDWFDDKATKRDREKRTFVWDDLEAAGIRVLENDAAAVDFRGQEVWVAGLGSQLAYIESLTRRSGRDDMNKTLAAIKSDAPALLIAHEPNLFPNVPARFALTISGHTHGGQIRMKGRGLTSAKMFGTCYDYGHYVTDDKHLVVSGGLGYSVAPVRLNNPPEITVIDLLSEYTK